MPAFRTDTEIETFSSLVNETIKSIVAEVELHKKLLENAKTKQQVILDRDIDKLQELTRWDEAILEEVAKWEDHMEQTAKALAVLWREDPHNLSMSRILELLSDEPEAIKSLVPQLEEAKKEFQVILEELKLQNDKNTILLRRSLAVVNYSLDVVLGQSQESSIYNDKGRRYDSKNSAGKKRIFDTQV